MFGWLKNQSLEHFLRAAVVVTLSLFSAYIHAVVAVDNVSTVVGAGPTSLSVSHTTAGTDRLMIG